VRRLVRASRGRSVCMIAFSRSPFRHLKINLIAGFGRFRQPVGL
jgi:hypothetical protein